MWNSIALEIKTSKTLNIFKNKLIKKDKDRLLFQYGPRHLQLILSRIRMGCSALNGHLHHFLKVIEKPDCACGYFCETPKHYFLSCPLYAALRIKLLQEISNITVVNINIILFGDNHCSTMENKLIFDAVFEYLEKSKRFSIKKEIF